ETPLVVYISPTQLGTINDPDRDLVNVYNTLICQLATILIIDTESAQILAQGADSSHACAQKLMEQGCDYVLIKNCSPAHPSIENELFGNHRLLQSFNWERIPGNYHGCGCTLSAAMAGLMAHKLTIPEAVVEAQKY